MRVTLDYFDIEYTKKDEKYIDLVIEELKEKNIEIMSFFNLEKLSRKIQIKFWSSLKEYRDFFNKRMEKYNKKVNDWEVGRATNNQKECRIDLLCLSERKKCKGHAEDTIDNLLKVTIHEFTHICHFEYSNRLPSMTWFLEALATNLSNQYDNLDINCSLEDILEGKAHYSNYYAMGKYLLDNYDRSYILELAKNKDLLESETEKIFIHAVEYSKTNQKKLDSLSKSSNNFHNPPD